MNRLLALAPLLVLSACSGTGGGGSPATVAPSTTAASAAVDDAAESGADDDSGDENDDGDENAALADVVPQWSVTVDVAVDGFDGEPIDTSVGWTGDPNAVVEDGPFGSYGSCSGLRDHVGAYSVFVSGAGELGLVGVWTADRVSGAGTFDAEVRVEPPDGPPLTANGTITILGGLQRGDFLAFGPDGGRIEGTFSCSGADPATPIDPDADGIDPAVEVFAVVRDGDTERIVGLVTGSDDEVSCAGRGDVVVGVDGDASTGAITTFELRAEPNASVRLRVAGADYEFPDVAVRLDESGTSGVFTAATIDGTSVDGAFRCT